MDYFDMIMNTRDCLVCICLAVLIFRDGLWVFFLGPFWLLMAFKAPVEPAVVVIAPYDAYGQLEHSILLRLAECYGVFVCLCLPGRILTFLRILQEMQRYGSTWKDAREMVASQRFFNAGFDPAMVERYCRRALLQR